MWATGDALLSACLASGWRVGKILHYISCVGHRQAGRLLVWVNKIICWSVKLHTATAGTLALASTTMLASGGGGLSISSVINYG